MVLCVFFSSSKLKQVSLKLRNRMSLIKRKTVFLLDSTSHRQANWKFPNLFIFFSFQNVRFQWGAESKTHRWLFCRIKPKSMKHFNPTNKLIRKNILPFYIFWHFWWNVTSSCKIRLSVAQWAIITLAQQQLIQ